MHPEVIKIKSPPGTPWLQGKVTEFTWMADQFYFAGFEVQSRLEQIQDPDRAR